MWSFITLLMVVFFWLFFQIQNTSAGLNASIFPEDYLYCPSRHVPAGCWTVIPINQSSAAAGFAWEEEAECTWEVQRSSFKTSPFQPSVHISHLSLQPRTISPCTHPMGRWCLPSCWCHSAGKPNGQNSGVFGQTGSQASDGTFRHSLLLPTALSMQCLPLIMTHLMWELGCGLFQVK